MTPPNAILKWYLATTVVVQIAFFPLAAIASSAKPVVSTFTLPSGQQVYVQEIHQQPIVTIDTWVNTGSAKENAQNNGVSHFLEHLLFKGTQKHKIGEIDRRLESRGAVFNAATSDDFTHYHITTATPYFKEALELHADMLLNATINPPELNRERKVVQEEINRALDNPGRKVAIALNQLLFKGHPYALDTLGPKSNIQTIPRESILEYYHRWYRPNQFKTIIAGDINPKEAREAVLKAFEQNQKNSASPPLVNLPIASPLKQPASKILTDPNLSTVQFQMGFVAPPASQVKENAALDVAAMILGQGESSRLNQVVKEQNSLVQNISAANSTQQLAGTFGIDAEILPENRQKAKQLILQVLQTFIANGPTAEELEKAKKQVLKEFAFLTESTTGVANTIGYNATIADLKGYQDYVEVVQSISKEDVQAALKKTALLSRAAIVEALPTSLGENPKQQEALNIALLNESHPVASPQETTTTLTEADFQKSLLPSGATLVVKPNPTANTIAIQIFGKVGQWADEKPGTTGLMGRVLLKGTHNRSAEQISQELETNGLSILASSDDDYFQITATAMAQDTDKLLNVLGDILTQANFPLAELEKERTLSINEIKASLDDPATVMFNQLTQTLYPNHPYGQVGTRLLASLPCITHADVIKAYQTQLTPSNLVIVATGNINPTHLTPSLNQLLGQLPKTPVLKTTPYKPVPALAQNQVVKDSKPEQAATWIGQAWLAPGISDDIDYITLKVINTLLGSGLSSRLFVELREKQGLAYHVASQFASARESGYFLVYIGTDPKNETAVLKGFQTQIERLISEPVSETELSNAKSKLIGNFALAHESNANQAYYPGFYETVGMGYTFDKRYPQLVQSVTAQDIQRVAKRILSAPSVTSIVSPQKVRTDAPAAN